MKIKNIVIILFIISISCIGCVEYNESKTIQSTPPESYEIPTLIKAPTSTPTARPTLTETQKKIIIIEEILDEYHENHVYMSDNIFDCDNMAQDVWNIFKAKGINSKLVLGNVDHFGPLTLDDCNHVWLLVEVLPNEWLAVETTGGFVVYKEDNDKYYEGYYFSNPKNYRKFVDLYEDYTYQYADYKNEWEYYNQLVKIYNNANYYEQIQLKSALDVTKNNLEIKERRFSETLIKIETILEYG